MNKNAIQKMMIAAIACIALCGTTLAAPAHKPAQGRAPAPQVQKAHRPAPVVQKAHKPARAPQTAHKPAPRVAAPDGRLAVGGYPAPPKAPGAKPMPKHAPQVAHHRAPVRHAAPRTTLAAADAVGYAQSICPATPCHRHHHCHGWRPAPPPPPPPCRWGRW